jgi:amine acid ABC transporter, permease protein, 3-TM region, His/Glu/Gln/Arg/opine family
MIDLPFFVDSLTTLARGIPLTLQLTAMSVLLGAVAALGLALMRVSGFAPLDLAARLYIVAFRGTPLLVQIYLIYFGLGQFPELRQSFLWPFLREAYWCAVLALALNTAAYGAEIIRGGLIGVPAGQIEAARAFGMSRFLAFRRIILPQAIRLMLPAYGNEAILMVKATALASTITLMEVTGIAAKLISQTYRPIEVFACAGVIYLAINFIVARAFLALQRATAWDRKPPALRNVESTRHA